MDNGGRTLFVTYYGDGAVLTAAEGAAALGKAVNATMGLERGSPPEASPYVAAKWFGVPDRVADLVLDYTEGNRGKRTGETVRDGYEAARLLREAPAAGFVAGGRFESKAERETVLHGTGVGRGSAVLAVEQGTETFRTSIANFFAVNHFPEGIRRSILKMEPGDVAYFGGGAAATYTVRRIE